MSPNATLVWFRLDLRVEDNRALCAAIDRGMPVIPVFVWSPDEEGTWPPGSASHWWLHQSLQALDAQLRGLGSRLIVTQGETLPTSQAREGIPSGGRLLESASRTGGDQARSSDRDCLAADGLTVETFADCGLFEPEQIRTRNGLPYQVYTPFWKACRQAERPATPLPAPGQLAAPAKWPASLPLPRLGLEPRFDWATGMRAEWRPGSFGAQERLKRFLNEGLDDYHVDRDRPDLSGTSTLSPHLHFGEISPRTVWHHVCAKVGKECSEPAFPRGAEVFLKELVWREFAQHLLYHFPRTTDEPLRTPFAKFPWRSDSTGLTAWQRGRTGYPLVDAGMRQLWAIGWMHNRVRMVTASFLVKHLLLSWQSGARWFWDTLVDADLANNTLGWQWTAGCGADAAPYFRIFNPVRQGEKFDPAGDYVRRWLPELAALPAEVIHCPWEASREILAEAGVRLGETYPRPIVEHAEARRRALAALASLSR